MAKIPGIAALADPRAIYIVVNKPRPDPLARGGNFEVIRRDWRQYPDDDAFTDAGRALKQAKGGE